MSATTTHGVKCGSCKGYHPSAMDVKACYGNAAFASGQAAATKQLDENAGQVVTYPLRPPGSAYEPVKGDVHVLDGKYYRVHKSQGTDRHYACRWDGERFEYARGAIRRLSKRTMVTAEQAKAFGEMTGQCVFCSRPIDTPESVAVGYGPICAAKYDLPWG